MEKASLILSQVAGCLSVVMVALGLLLSPSNSFGNEGLIPCPGSTCDTGCSSCNSARCNAQLCGCTAANKCSSCGCNASGGVCDCS